MDQNEIEGQRRSFPITEKYVYLDHAGIAPVSAQVKDAVCGLIAQAAEEGAFSYPDWAKQVDRVRSSCGKLINAEGGEIAFVRSTSHGLSIAAQGMDWKQGDNVLFCDRDFPANQFPWMRLERRGVEARRVPSQGGRIMMEDVLRLVDSRTRLIAVSSVQFISGFRMDLRKLGEECRKRGIVFCVDAIQSLGILPMDVQECGIDLLAADAHKWMLGPEGIGIFYCRKGMAERLEPPLLGWKSVKKEFDFEEPSLELKTDALRFEEGSQSLISIIGLGAAIELLLEIGIERIGERVLDLGERIIREADQRGFSVLTPRKREERGGHVTVAGGFDPFRMRDMLRQQGIMVNVRGGGIRIAPHFYITEDEIAKCFTVMDRLRKE